MLLVLTENLMAQQLDLGTIKTGLLDATICRWSDIARYQHTLSTLQLFVDTADL